MTPGTYQHCHPKWIKTLLGKSAQADLQAQMVLCKKGSGRITEVGLAERAGKLGGTECPRSNFVRSGSIFHLSIELRRDGNFITKNTAQCSKTHFPRDPVVRTAQTMRSAAAEETGINPLHFWSRGVVGTDFALGYLGFAGHPAPGCEKPRVSK